MNAKMLLLQNEQCYKRKTRIMRVFKKINNFYVTLQ